MISNRMRVVANVEYSTGYGQHADYVFGWKGNALQTAMDNACFGATCKGLTTQTLKAANGCSVKNTVSENTEGCKFYIPILVNCKTANNFQGSLRSQVEGTASK
jgi:hypothetical protein